MHLVGCLHRCTNDARSFEHHVLYIRRPTEIRKGIFPYINQKCTAWATLLHYSLFFRDLILEYAPARARARARVCVCVCVCDLSFTIPGSNLIRWSVCFLEDRRNLDSLIAFYHATPCHMPYKGNCTLAVMSCVPECYSLKNSIGNCTLTERELRKSVLYPLSYGVPVRERYGSTLLPATREQHDQNCTQIH